MEVKTIPEKITCPVCRETVKVDGGKIEAHCAPNGWVPCSTSGEPVVRLGDDTPPSIEARELLLALVTRDRFLEFLKKHDLPYRVLPEDHPDDPNEIQFELGGEHWLATYKGTRYFKMLFWA